MAAVQPTQIKLLAIIAEANPISRDISPANVADNYKLVVTPMIKTLGARSPFKTVLSVVRVFGKLRGVRPGVREGLRRGPAGLSFKAHERVEARRANPPLYLYFHNRPRHLGFDPLHHASTGFELAGGFENAFTARQRCADAASFVASSSPTNRLPALGALLSRPGKPGVYPFPDDRALEFSKYTICRGIFNRDTPGECLRSYRASWITGIDKRTFALKIDRAPTINIIFLLITEPAFASLQLFKFLSEFRQFRSQRPAIQRETAP